MDLSKTLERALNLLEQDITRIEVLFTSSSEPLDRVQAVKLTDYIKTLVTAAKNERDAAKSDGLDTLSDEELEQMAMAAYESLKGDNK